MRSSGGRGIRSPYLALLPLRFFFGITFLYAGLDKLLDPTFLHETGRGSIGAQMTAWVDISPLGGLVQTFLPYAVPVGIAISFAEICVGIGAVIGLAYRLSAFGGMLLSLLFFLTASWAVHPYYLGNDLPYAVGWGTLALAGSGGFLTIDAWLSGRASAARVGGPADGLIRQRRLILRAGVLAFLGLCVAGIATAAQLALGRHTEGPGVGTSPSPTVEGSPSPSPLSSPSTSPSPGASPSTSPSAAPSASPTPSSSPSASVSPSPSSPPVGKLLAHTADVTVSHPVVFQDPYTSDPGILLKLRDGSFVAFDTVCTHAACTVEFDPTSGYLVCPCHAATFDPAQDAKAIDGPTFIPLMEFPIVVDQAAGTIRLEGE